MLLFITPLLAFLAGWLIYRKHNRWGVCILLLLFACQGLLVIDSAQHWGTHPRITTTSERIAPVVNVKGNKLLVTEKIKKGKSVYMAYATRKPAHSKITIILNEHNDVKTDFHVKNGIPSMVTEDVRYSYTNAFSKLMFSGITNDNQQKQCVIIYRLTTDWYSISKNQLKELSKTLRNKSTQQKLKMYVTGELKKRVQKTPKLAANKKKLQQLTHSYITVYIGKIIKAEQKRTKSLKN